MKLTPFTPKNRDLSRFFDEDFFFGLPVMPMNQMLQQAQSLYPALDVIEDKDRYLFKADLPGMKKEDIKVSVEDGILTIEGERKSESEHKDKQVHRIERSYGRFVRTFNLGTQIDSAKVNAAYKDGVLEISVPKTEAARPKVIDVRVD